MNWQANLSDCPISRLPKTDHVHLCRHVVPLYRPMSTPSYADCNQREETDEEKQTTNDKQLTAGHKNETEKKQRKSK